MPHEIIPICILYCKPDEMFGIASDGGIKVSENKKIITKVGKKYNNDFHNNNYGMMEIESVSDYKYQYDLKLIKRKHSRSVSVGITSKIMPNENLDNKTQKIVIYDYIFTENGQILQC